MTESKNTAQSFIPVAASELLDKVQDLKSAGYRLGQLCASEVGDEFQLLYSFDKDYELLNLKLTVNQEEKLPSITGIYWSAFIYENEIRDLFGFTFKNLVLDYGGHFFKTATPTPWNPTAEVTTESPAAVSAPENTAADVQFDKQKTKQEGEKDE